MFVPLQNHVVSVGCTHGRLWQQYLLHRAWRMQLGCQQCTLHGRRPSRTIPAMSTMAGPLHPQMIHPFSRQMVMDPQSILDILNVS